jgi:2-dehydropantoate 2-reductase
LQFADPVSTVEEVARRTATNHSSMFQDVRRGVQTEIDSICGAVVKSGEQCGVSTPVNRTMWQLVNALLAG